MTANNNNTSTNSTTKSQRTGAGNNTKPNASNANGRTSESTVSDVMSSVSEFGKNFFSGMSGSKEKVVESAADALHGIEQSVRKNPWAYIGGAVALGFAAGYFVTRKSPTALIATGAKELKNKIEENINKVSEHLQ